MKNLYRLFIFILAFSSTITFGQNLLLEENFNYPAGTLVNTIAGFNSRSTSGAFKQTIASTGLSYSGYLSSAIGKSDSLTADGDDFSRDFALYAGSGQPIPANAITTGSVYLSALVNVLSAANPGDYFLSFHWNNTFNGKVFVQSNGNGYSFATAKSTVGTYESTVRTFGTTYLVVVKYTFSAAGTTDDRIDMWINPDVSSGTEPASVAPFSNITEAARNDYAAVGGVAIRQGGATSAPKVLVDGIRIAPDWAALMMGKLVSVEKNDNEIPTDFTVEQNYPNPFNPSTLLSYNLPHSGQVNIAIYNSLGQKITNLFNGETGAGRHQISWNGKNQSGNEVSSGVYFARITFGNQSRSIKMLLTR